MKTDRRTSCLNLLKNFKEGRMIEAQFSATANKTNTELLPYVVIEYLNLKRERGASRASGRFFADNSIKLRVVRKSTSLQRKKHCVKMSKLQGLIFQTQCR